jgi:hypothetical protein
MGIKNALLMSALWYMIDGSKYLQQQSSTQMNSFRALTKKPINCLYKESKTLFGDQPKYLHRRRKLQF